MGRFILERRKTNVRIYSSPIPINHSLTRVLFPRLSIKTENIATPSSLPQGIYCKRSSIFFLLHQEESGGSLFQWKDKTENIATSSSRSHWMNCKIPMFPFTSGRVSWNDKWNNFCVQKDQICCPSYIDSLVVQWCGKLLKVWNYVGKCVFAFDSGRLQLS